MPGTELGSGPTHAALTRLMLCKFLSLLVLAGAHMTISVRNLMGDLGELKMIVH